MPGDEIELASNSLERVLIVAAFFRHQGERTLTIDEVIEQIREYASLAEPKSAARKFRRDREDLAAANIVIELTFDPDHDAAEPGDHHRYGIRDPRMERTFRADERAALLAAAAAVHIDGLEEDDPADLGGNTTGRAAPISVRIPAIVADLQAPVVERRLVEFRYKDTLRRVEPYRVGIWRNAWYLIARDTADGGIKRWALERIAPSGGGPAVRVVSDRHAFAKVKLDYAAQFALDPNTWGDDPEIEALVRIPRRLRPAFTDVFDGVSNHEWVGDDEVVVTFTVRHLESTITRLLGFGDRAHVVGPPELVAAFTEWLEPQAGAT